MRIENVFEVQAPPDVAWALLTDVPRVLPCIPGAAVEQALGDDAWQVVQRVKLGPISLQFRSEVTRTELSEAERRAVLSVSAKEVRGRGGADAVIESRLEPVEGGTRVVLVTELALRGAVAQYGRAVIGSVAEELAAQFASCLASMLQEQAPRPAPSAPPPGPAAAGPVGGLRLVVAALRRRLRRRS